MCKMLLAALAAVAFSATVLAADNTPPKSFTALFNGKDFTGWQSKHGKVESEEERTAWQEHWKVKEGIIQFDGQGPDLWTAKKFRDFILMMDWRFPKPGDSGVYLRGDSKSQVNIWCDEMGSGEVWGYRTDQNQPEQVRKACTPIKKTDKPVGQWNTFVITMKSDRLTVRLNGETVIHNAQLPGVPPEGALALQRHGSPIEFKNIYLKKLGSAGESAGGPPAAADAKVQAIIDELEKDCVQRGIRLLAPQKAARLAELIRQKKPRVVVECGTAVGYSGLWIARELKSAGRGRLVTIEIMPELSREAGTHLRQAGLADHVTLKVGDARKVVKELEGPIDFVFLDCNPPNYYACFLGLEDKLSKGAIVVADNAGYGASGMTDYLKHVRSKYQSRTEWFDINLPWAKRDAIEVTIIAPPQAKQP
jgi:predicted O-methyltransferase YrrM